jgi:hypothetical protein
VNAKRKDKTGTVDHPYFDRPSEPLLRTGGRTPTDTGPRLDWRQALGGLFIVGGFISLVAGYIGISGTKETYDQLSYFLSNGLGGAAAIVVGSTILIIREHVEDRQAMRMIDERLCRLEHSQNEAELAGLTAAVVQHS